jgi:pimeloyl-ACP methyl ester carboxylesterase
LNEKNQAALRRREVNESMTLQKLLPASGMSRRELLLNGAATAARVDKGGHFAAWEEPQLFSAELRAAFRSLR